MTNYSSGHDAEKVAAKHLAEHGYKIVELNWRHARAEIDIVATPKSKRYFQKQPIIFFEVKYRRTAAQGLGLDYITPAKLKQMRFAAELWVAQHKYSGEYTLGAVEVFGDDYHVTAVLESVT